MPKKEQKGAGSSGHSRAAITIDPSKVYFTHARVRPIFTGCNKRIEQTLEEIVSGQTSIRAIPKITVLNNNGHLFSLNNRRLFLFKELHKRGLLSEVEVQLKEATDKEKARYTPERCTLNAKLMKEFSKADGKPDDEENGEVDEPSEIVEDGRESVHSSDLHN